MTDYTKSTSFSSKDSLPSGDPLKIVKGTEIDTEFNNIQTAVATKADSASPTFTGTPAAPTASSGTSTTQLATTAFVTTGLNALYPVGSIYSSTVSTNPNTLFGFGTWVAFAAGRVMVGNGGGFSAGATGGSADAIVVSHTHTATDAGHTHTYSGNVSPNDTFQYSGGGGNAGIGVPYKAGSTTASGTASITVASAGSSGTNANLQPYIVVYMWNRTA